MAPTSSSDGSGRYKTAAPVAGTDPRTLPQAEEAPGYLLARPVSSTRVRVHVRPGTAGFVDAVSRAAFGLECSPGSAYGEAGPAGRLLLPPQATGRPWFSPSRCLVIPRRRLSGTRVQVLEAGRGGGGRRDGTVAVVRARWDPGGGVAAGVVFSLARLIPRRQ